MIAPDSAMHAHYARGQEMSRLDDPKSVLEFERTKLILQRALPPAPARIADVGGGPERYALWLAERGHPVEHRDLMPLHVEQVQAADVPSVRAAVGDARALDLGDASSTRCCCSVRSTISSTARTGCAR